MRLAESSKIEALAMRIRLPYSWHLVGRLEMPMAMHESGHFGTLGLLEQGGRQALELGF